MRKKKFKRKVKLLLILMFITSLYLSATTYSWFSVNRVVYISDLNIKVQAQGGIEISTDGISWNTTLLRDDIINANLTYPSSVNQLPNSMEPVSTGKNVINGKLDMYYGYTENLGNSYILMAEKSVEKEGHGDASDGKFMAFDIFLKSTFPSDLYLSNESGVNYIGSNPGIENSVRFAFLVEGNVPVTSDTYTIQNLSGATSDTTYIWEPNYDVHTENGIKNAKEQYGLVINKNNNNQILYDGIVANITKNDKILIEDANNKNHPSIFKRVDVDYITPNSFDTNIEVFRLDAGITKVRVYIWIEGQDVDCENNSAVGDIEFNFQFTTNPS